MRMFQHPGDKPEKRHVIRSFGKAADTYDALAELQRQVGRALLSRLDRVDAATKSVLDLGCGTGYCTARLVKRAAGGRVLALDIAPQMLRIARSRLATRQALDYVCGDGEALPLEGGSIDLAFSNLALQWCGDAERVFGELGRVLKPGGALLFSTFGPATLQELRAAWAKADSYRHINEFQGPAAIASAMAGAGFGDVRIEREMRLCRYGGVLALMRELKSIGAHNVNEGRPRHLMGKGAMRRMMDAYRSQAGGETILATFEILYGFAVKKGGR